MRHYEIVLLIHPDQSEQVPAMIGRYKKMVTAQKGLVHRAEDWGRRRLAYMINDIHKAHYMLLNIECGLESLRELEENFKFNDSIVRSLVIRREQAITEQSALVKAKVEEERNEPEKKAPRPAPDAGKNEAGGGKSIDSKDSAGESVDRKAGAGEGDTKRDTKGDPSEGKEETAAPAKPEEQPETV